MIHGNHVIIVTSNRGAWGSRQLPPRHSIARFLRRSPRARLTLDGGRWSLAASREGLCGVRRAGNTPRRWREARSTFRACQSRVGATRRQATPISQASAPGSPSGRLRWNAASSGIRILDGHEGEAWTAPTGWVGSAPCHGAATSRRKAGRRARNAGHPCQPAGVRATLQGHPARGQEVDAIWQMPPAKRQMLRAMWQTSLPNGRWPVPSGRKSVPDGRLLRVSGRKSRAPLRRPQADGVAVGDGLRTLARIRRSWTASLENLPNSPLYASIVLVVASNTWRSIWFSSFVWFFNWTL